MHSSYVRKERFGGGGGGGGGDYVGLRYIYVKVHGFVPLFVAVGLQGFGHLLSSVTSLSILHPEWEQRS